MTAQLQPEPLETSEEPQDRDRIRRLMLFFGLVYVVEGVGQTGGIIAQPLSYFLKEVHAFTPLQVTAFLTAFNLPWVIKPVYGLVSDFLPLLGYRRKSYLILANVLATGAYLLVARLGMPGQLLLALLLTAYAMAISSTLCGALLVENGQRFGASGAFVNQQWLWFNVAAMSASLTGGELIEVLPPTSALHSAALIAALAPILVMVGTFYLVTEDKTRVNFPELKNAFRGLLAAFHARGLWIVGLYLFFYYFSPGFATPLYYHMTDTLHFSQGYIGLLGSIGSAGSIVGALLHRWYLARMTSKRLLQLSIVLGTVTTLSFLLLIDETSAAILNFANGIAAMIALVATLTLAADYCPKRSEGFAFAVLMSVTNLASAASDNAGSFLYERAFGSRFAPLILVSAAFTAFAWLLIPLLRLGDKPQGQPVPG
ncbi:MAG TPA: MFS transporter [Xanthobacteraceae bacterium]